MTRTLNKIRQRMKRRKLFTDYELAQGRERDHYSFVCPTKKCVMCKRHKWRDKTKRRRRRWHKELEFELKLEDLC